MARDIVPRANRYNFALARLGKGSVPQIRMSHSSLLTQAMRRVTDGSHVQVRRSSKYAVLRDRPLLRMSYYPKPQLYL